MSKVDFHRNTFLEIEELNRFQKFMVESNVNKTFLSNTINWGIIDTSQRRLVWFDSKLCSTVNVTGGIGRMMVLIGIGSAHANLKA